MPSFDPREVEARCDPKENAVKVHLAALALGAALAMPALAADQVE